MSGDLIPILSLTLLAMIPSIDEEFAKIRQRSSPPIKKERALSLP